MCGIVGYVGPQDATGLLVEGLQRLEYRGYDSAGVALHDGRELRLARCVGRVSVLQEYLDREPERFHGRIGIAHTRWATHGKVTEENAHPHTADTADGHRIALVHNGIIENYASLRSYLEDKGHAFHGETDTEVLAKLIGELYDDHATSGAWTSRPRCRARCARSPAPTRSP